MKIIQRLHCLAFALSLLASPCVAQTTNGSMNGTVVDPSGSPVGGVQIQVTNKDTGAQRTVTTSDSGSYIVPQLPPGTYDVSVQKTGFATEDRASVQLLVNQRPHSISNSLWLLSIKRLKLPLRRLS